MALGFWVFVLSLSSPPLSEGLPHPRTLSTSVACVHSLGVLGQGTLPISSFWLKVQNRHKLDEVDFLCGLGGISTEKWDFPGSRSGCSTLSYMGAGPMEDCLPGAGFWMGLPTL